MGIYDRQAASALALIKRKGTMITISRAVADTFDPVTQERVPGVPITGDFYAVEIPPGRSAEFQIGSLVGRKVIQLYIARAETTMEPSLGDTTTWNGVEYTLLAPVTHYNPAADGAVLTVAYGEAG